jgi:hypothetical protein
MQANVFGAITSHTAMRIHVDVIAMIVEVFIGCFFPNPDKPEPKDF